MIVVCPSCQARYKFDESRLGDKPKAKTRCSKCGGTIEIENPALGSSTLPVDALEPPAPPPTLHSKAQAPEQTRTQRRVALEGEGQTPGGEGTIAGKDLHAMGVLQLPKDKRFSLAIIQGAATGQIYQIAKTRTTIGRSGADINLTDPEASRSHAVVEIFGDRCILRDQGSTNGTWVEMDRIDHVELTNHMEFRIGSHLIMFIVTEVE
jgi:predicted Zn finger-like uncharacterized protein